MGLARLHTPVVLAELLRNYDVALGYMPAFGHALDPGLARRPHAFPGAPQQPELEAMGALESSRQDSVPALG